MLGLAFFGPNWSLWLLFAVAGAIGAWEYLNMTLRGAIGLDGWWSIAGVFGLVSAFYWTDSSLVLLGVGSVTGLGVFLIGLRGAPDAPTVAPRLGHILAGWAYTGFLFSALAMLVRAPDPMVHAQFQSGWLLFPMAVIWAGDTGAYFAGRAFGGPKLAPIVSPNKTRSGAAGGLVASVAGGYLAWFVFGLPTEQMPAWMVLVFAIPGAMLGQFGDLCESLIKRSVGAKDSGTILYGHGGMLDRVDALVFAAPWFVLWKTVFDLPTA